MYDQYGGLCFHMINKERLLYRSLFKTLQLKQEDHLNRQGLPTVYTYY